MFQTYQFQRGQGWTKLSAFTLHQVVERLYHGYLLIHTNYSPATHNIKYLRSLAEDRDQSLVPAWPRTKRAETKLFNKLKDAYVKARYSKHFRITDDELDWLETCVMELTTVVEASCAQRLRELTGDAPA